MRTVPPKRVPLGPEDVDLHKDLFRPSEDVESECTANRKTAEGLYLAAYCTPYTWRELVGAYEISRDGGKTWEPCSKEAI